MQEREEAGHITSSQGQRETRACLSTINFLHSYTVQEMVPFPLRVGLPSQLIQLRPSFTDMPTGRSVPEIRLPGDRSLCHIDKAHYHSCTATASLLDLEDTNVASFGYLVLCSGCLKVA